MDWNIWSSSYDQDVLDDNNFEQLGSQFNYNYGYGRDVIEEEALNEKYCIQVLNILIRNADAQIEELEMELLSLQNELQPEPKKWLKICRSALSKKINQLDGSIRSLKNEGSNAIEIQQQSHKPAETLEEILKALRKDYFQEVYKQTANTNVKGSSPGSQKLAADHFKEEKISAVTHSDGTQEEEAKERSFTAEDGQFVGNISLGSEETRCIPESLSNVDIKDCCKDASRDATEANPIPAACSMTLCSVLEPKEKAPDSSKSATELLMRKPGRSPNMGVIRRRPGQSDRIKTLGIPDKNVSGNDVVGRSQVITTDRGHILNSFPSTCKGNIPKEVKQENATVKDVSANDFRLETGIKARKECLGSKLQQGRSENLDLDLKLCSLAPKPSARDGKLSDEEKPDKIDLKPEINANICNSNTSLPLKKKVDRKRKPELETFGGRELSDNPREVILDSSSKVASKLQWKSSTGVNGASLNRPLNGKITQRAVQPGQDAISELPITADIKNSTVNMELPSSDRVATDNRSQKHPQIGRSDPINSHNRKTSPLLQSDISSLEGLTVKDLRAIAKRHNMRGYSKLTKAAIIEALKQLLDD